MARRWRNLIRSLGESFVEVVEAEATALRDDLAESGRRFSRGLALAAVAAFALFWAVGAAGFAVYQAFCLWIPAWGAALSVLGIFLLLALILALLARRRWASIESPTDTFRRRLDDHVDWWHEELLPEQDRLAPPRLTAPEIDDDE